MKQPNLNPQLYPLNRLKRLLLLALFVFLFSDVATAQPNDCNQIIFNFEQYDPCRYRVTYNNSSECYTLITLSLEQGSFASWNIVPNSGFIIQAMSASELWITHSGGFIPLGAQTPILFTLPPDLVTNLNVSYVNDCPPGVGCALFPGITIESCPDLQNASISGVKYRECGSSPYLNQPTVPGWPIQLLDEAGNLLSEQETDSGGSYAFFNLPYGNYLVKEVQRVGWSPSVPASGQAVVSLDPSEQAIQNFGNCPGCSCDSIYMDVVQSPFTSDTCGYTLSATNTGGYCFKQINVSIPSGTITAVNLNAGWTAVQVDAQHIQLFPPGNFIPTGNVQPCFFKVTGSATQQITVSTSWLNGNVPVNCSRDFSFQCPPPASPPPCCPMGSIFGTELVKNSTFQLGNQDFTNDYNYFNPGLPTTIGSYSVLNQSQIFAANSQWACSDHTGLGGNMLIIDGYGGPVAWQQTVNVVAGTQYSFSAWVNNLVIPTKNYDDPQVALFVGTTPVAGPIIFQETPDQWVRLCGTFTAMASGPVVLSLQVLTTTVIGNDFAVDDISFRSCGTPQPCQVAIQVSQAPNDCTVTVTATTTGPQPISYQWCDGRTDASFTTTQLPCVPQTYCVTATCSDGSTSTASVVFTAKDLTPPVAICNLGVGVDLGANCNFQVTPAFVDGGSTDNCGIMSMSVSPTSLGSCTNTLVTLTVTDWCGNTSTCSMGIQTAENVPPVMTCPANTTINGVVGPTGICTATFSPITPVATDNCDPSVTVTNNAPAVLQQGPNTIVWTATDDCGNKTTCSQIVTVQCGCDCVGNLVVNGGFENGTAGAPNALNQINQCTGWTAASNNPAANNIGDWYSNANPIFPGYYLGPNQTELPAHCGNKYAGFFLSTCEGITTALSQTITQGCSYEVGFWWTPAVTPTAPFSFFAVMSGGSCTMYHPTGSCSHQCNGDQHVVVNVTPSHVPGTWYYHSMTVANAYPNVGYMTFTAAQGQPTVNNYIFVDDVCVKKIAEPCSVTASIYCHPQNPTAYTAQATLGCGSVVTQVDWYFDGVGPTTSTNLNSVLHPFNTIGWHNVCLVVTASADGGQTICKDSVCKEIYVDHAPPTKCDSISVTWQKLRTPEHLCCYELQVDNLAPNCFVGIELTLNAGTFTNASIASGWTVIGSLTSNQIILVSSVGAFLPSGFFSPLTLCDPGGTGPYALTVNLYYGQLPNLQKCEKLFNYDCPDLPIDSCCIDYDLFCTNVENAVNVVVDNANCKATLQIGALPGCDYIEKIFWGDGTQTNGQFVAGAMPMHNYAQSGTYVIQYLAIEVSPHTGLICFEKLLSDTIVLVCDDCCKDEQAFLNAAANVQTNAVFSNCSISVNGTGLNDCMRISWDWGDGTSEGPYSNNTPVSHTYSTYGLYVVTCTITEVNQLGEPCFSIVFTLDQRVECYAECPDCDENLVQNPGFFEGAVGGELGSTGASNFWSAAPNTTPDVSQGIFCCDAFGIQLFGSQNNGEAICQTGLGFDPNKTYSISFSAYYFQPASVAPYVQFGFYAANSCANPFTGCTGCETIGISSQITNQNCATYTLPNWKPGNNYNTLIISALNANAFPNLSFGRIDNICIQEVKDTCATPPSGMVAWWPMDETFGDDNVADIVHFNDGEPKPNGLVGVPDGPDPVPGKVGGALNFISVPSPSQYLQVNDVPSLNFGSGSFSIDAWVYTDMGTQTEPIVDKLGPTNNGYSFSIQGSSPFYPTLVVGTGTSVEVLYGPAFKTGEWNFVAVSVNGQNATFYVGNSTGFFTSSSPFTSTYNASNTSRPLLIGNNPFNPHWNISIDELELFNKALDTLEVSSIWNAGSAGKCKTLVGVNTPSDKIELRLYPNPNTGSFSVECTEAIKRGTTFKILDLTGRLVQEESAQAGLVRQTLQVESLPAGLYFLQVVHEGKVLAVEKFVKQ